MAKKSQIEKFREKARELGTDLDEAKFDEALRKAARVPSEQSGAASEPEADDEPKNSK